MAMKKADRKKAFIEVIELMLKDRNKEAYSKLVCFCGEDTELFVMADYDETIKKYKRMNKGK